MAEKRNHFLNSNRVRKYASARPALHAKALEAYLGTTPKMIFDRILDVACGTGQSSIALTKWGKAVDAIDNSKPMLELAIQAKNLTYHFAKAEELPFADNTFDLIFVASSLHWLERRKFFNEAARVLKPGGKILVYDSVLKSGLSSQFTLEFNQRFPKAYNEVPLHPSELQVFNLKLGRNYRYEFDSCFKTEQIINYFFTLSSVTLSLENGDNEEKAYSDIKNYVAANATNEPFIFEVSLTEMTKL